MTSKPVLDVFPPTKRKKSNTTNVSTCLFCKEICNEQHTYTLKQWDALRLTAKEWSGLDRYGFFMWKLIGKKVRRMSSSITKLLHHLNNNDSKTIRVS